MAIKVVLQREAQPIFQRMAKEAGLGVRDLAEIACYNLIAIYLKEHGEEVDAQVFAPKSNPSSQPNNLSV